MLDLLKKYFGYDEFRPLQKEIIERVMSRQDAVALMPTGGGKSLCYQLPALMFPGLTVVISPLISLMKDQVDGLVASGIEAEFINSSIPQAMIAEILDRAQKGLIKILYIAPERLKTLGFREILQKLEVSLIAIDEAHCISEWGHDFRPEYRTLNTLKTILPGVPIIALTATATEQVRFDIVKQLNLTNPEIFIASFNRPNLKYSVMQKKQFGLQILELLEKYKNQSAILYCFSRNRAETIAESLKLRGVKAAAYHAGLDGYTRNRIQDEFIKDEINVITATIAFGMGIDKPDVRLVVHCDLPKSVEGYYQETGRAGRDGLPAECVLFCSRGDVRKHAFFIEGLPDENLKKLAYAKLDEMLLYGEKHHCRRKYLLAYFGEEFPKDNCENCDGCLRETKNVDATVVSQKILSAILKTGQQFGGGYITNVLIGEADERMRERGHDLSSVFGIAKDLTKREILTVVRQLLTHGLIVQTTGEYPILKVSDEGKKFLKNRETLELPEIAHKRDKKERKAVQQNINYDIGLFDELRLLRKRIADMRGVPPYIIFGDKALQEMAYYFPKQLSSLSEISGVGQQKLNEFGQSFLAVIVQYALEHNLSEKEIPKKEKKNEGFGSSIDFTKQLLTQKVSVDEICKQRGLKLSTVVDHIEKIIQMDGSLDISYLYPDKERLLAIKNAYEQSNGWLLTPVKEILGEDFSFDEIKIARIVIHGGK